MGYLAQNESRKFCKPLICNRIFFAFLISVHDVHLFAMIDTSNDKTFISRLRELPFIATAFAESEAAAVKRRQTVLDAIARADSEAAVRLPQIRRAVEEQRGEVKKAEAALQVPYTQLGRLVAESSVASATYDHYRNRLEATLADSPAAAIIDAFRRKCLDLIDDARKSIVTFENKHPVLNGAPICSTGSNASQIVARTTALMEARDVAHRLRFSADQRDIETQLAALLINLPSVEIPLMPVRTSCENV